MPLLRRLIALSFFPLSALSGLAQSGPTESTAEKITLDQAIQRALAKNFAIKVEGFDAAIAAAGVTTALGKFDPVINGSYTYSESDLPSLLNTPAGLRSTTFSKTDEADAGLGGLLPWGMTYKLGANSINARGTFNSYADNYSTFAGLSGTQPLLRGFGFGNTLASIRIAQANRSIGEWQFRLTVMDTITRVIFAYHDLNFAYAAQRSALRSRELAAQLLSENEKRFKVGNVSEYDVNSSRSRVASREEGILLAERQVLEAGNALKQLITDEKSPNLLTTPLAIEPPPPAPVVVVDAVADFRLALEKRPDYQQVKLVLRRDSVSARLALNQMLPRVDLVGSYGYNGYDTDLKVSRQQIRNEDYRSYSWGVVVSVPLTFTTERGRYRAARLQQRQSETLVEQVEQNIVVLVGNAANQIETAQKRIQATRRARELAQEVLDSEVKRFRAGQSSTFFVSQQQEILSGAEVLEARAQSDYHKALADYDRQLGLTLDKLNVKLDPPR
ncbi:MAG: bepC [Lacunisphaera sp.]|nr:bepC [Lacunisphaera sp.]